MPPINSNPSATPVQEPLAYSVPEAARHLGNCSRAYIFKLIKNGQLRPVRVGRRTLIPRAEILRLLSH